MQPPLYYVLATPAFLLPFDHREKVFVLRAFDVLLLASALALAAALARNVLGERWLVGYAAVLAVVLWPGVLVRMVTISNDVLAVPAGLLFALLAWQAWTRRSTSRLVLAGAVFGLLVLTKITLLFFAPVLVLLLADALRWRVSGAGRAAALSFVLAAAPVVAWAIVNDVRYGRLGLAEGSPEIAALFPADPLASAGLPAQLGRLLVGSLPQEFAARYEPAGLGAVVTRALVCALVAFGVSAAAVAWRRLSAPALAVLGLPLVAGVLGLVAESLSGDAEHFFGRYLYPAALLFALFGAVGWVATGRERVAIAWASVTSLLAAAFWVHLAGAYYFVDVGRRLGIA
jgi:hypothetical protein